MATTESLQRILNNKRIQAAMEKKKSNSNEPKSFIDNWQEKRKGSFGEALDVGFLTGIGSTRGGSAQLFNKTGAGDRNYFEYLRDMESGALSPEERGKNIAARNQELSSESQAREQRYGQVQKNNPTGAFLGNMIGAGVSTAPLAAIPGLGATSIGARLAASGLGRGALATGRGAVEGGLAAGAQYVPEGQSRLENTTSGAAWGAGPAAALQGIGGTYNALSPTGIMRRQAGNQDFAANFAAAEGTETPFGKIVNSPFLNTLHEKLLMNMPASGAVQAAQRTQSLIENRGNELIENITGGKLKPGIKPQEELVEGLKDIDESIYKASKANYNQTQDLADRIGTKTNYDDLHKEADMILKEETGSELLGSFLSDDMKKDLEFYKKVRGGDTFKDSNLSRANLGDRQRFFNYDKTDMNAKHKSGIYGRLMDAIDRDMSNAINKTTLGTEKEREMLKKSYEEAQSFYKNEVVPLKDKLVSRYTHKNYDPDTIISAFFKPMTQGRERGVLLDKMTSLLGKSPEKENLMNALRAGIFAKAKDTHGNTDTNAIQDIIQKKIGNQYREKLFSGKESELKELDNLAKLNEMNKSSKAAMGSMFTGHGFLQALGWGLPIAGGYYGAKKGDETGIPGAGLLGAGAGAFLGSGFGPGRAATRKLTSPQKRQEILNPMEKSRLRKELQKQLGQGISRTTGAMSAQAEEEE